MPTPTTTYSLSKPTVGGDDNAWGTELNANLDKLDDLLDGTIGITPNLIAGWEVGGVAVTASAAELNLLDGVTASTAEINILDGVTYTLTDLNSLTASVAELNVLDGITATTAELNVLDGIAGIASQVEAEAGTATDKLMTPQRTRQAIDALASSESMTLLGTLTTTSGSVQTLSGLDLTGYKFLIFEFIGVSHTNPTSTNFRIASALATGSADAGQTVDGMVWVSLASGNVYLQGEVDNDNANATGYSTATTSVSVSPSAGNFDAGSIRIYGVK